MENKLDVRGILGMESSDQTEQTTDPTENNPSSEKETMESTQVYYGKIPQTNELSSWNLLFMGVLLCLMALTIHQLSKLYQRNKS